MFYPAPTASSSPQGKASAENKRMGISLDTWVWAPRVQPGDTGREAAVPSAGEAGLGGYRPTLASRGLGSASRPCRVVDALAEHTRAPGPYTQLPLPSTLGAPLREEEGGTAHTSGGPNEVL